MLHTKASRLAHQTQRYYRSQLTPFIIWCQTGAVYQVIQITPRLIRGYLVSLEERGLSDYSVHAAARAIRAFLNFCVREEIVSVSPMDKVSMPRVDRRVLPSLSNAEVHKLLSVCTSLRDETIILVLLDTGCRASELVNLDGRDVDLGNREVHVRAGKGGKDRNVFLGEHTKARLATYYKERGRPKPSEPIWLSQTRGERLTPSGLHQLLKRLGAQARVPHCAPHTFRRTFAISCLRNGMDLFRLARLMGHSDISVLRQYLFLLKEDLRKAHAQFGIVDRLLEV